MRGTTLHCLIVTKGFFLALIEHMKTVHPIDETRIYVSGFSMGGMMSNAMACALPNVVAAAAPCNAYNNCYFSSLSAMMRRLRSNNAVDMMDKSFDDPDEITQLKIEADQKKQNMIIECLYSRYPGCWTKRGR